MRDIDKLECIRRRAVGTMKDQKATGYKEQLMTLISFMLEERIHMENVNLATKYVKSCHMKEGVDLFFIILKHLRQVERKYKGRSLHQSCLGLEPVFRSHEFLFTKISK